MDCGFLESYYVTDKQDTYQFGDKLGFLIRKLLRFGKRVHATFFLVRTEWIKKFDLDPTVHRIKLSVTDIKLHTTQQKKE